MMPQLFDLANSRQGKFFSLDHTQRPSKRAAWKTCKIEWVHLYAQAMRDDIGTMMDRVEQKLNGEISQTTGTCLSTIESEHDRAVQPFDEGDFETSILNEDRPRHNARLTPLVRSKDLDALAECQVQKMAKACKVKHSNLSKLLEQMTGVSNKIGENVGRGRTFVGGHGKMNGEASNFWNLIDAKYSEVGIATAEGMDGKVYICQLFRG